MRRREREITAIEDILGIMKNCDVCSVAFAGGDHPYVIPLNFGVEEADGTVTMYFHGAGEGKKFERMGLDNKVGFCMYTGEELELGDTACSATMRYSSVCGSGRMEVVEERTERLKAVACIMNQYDRSERTEYDFDGRVMGKTTVLKITVEQITGKSNKKQ